MKRVLIGPRYDASYKFTMFGDLEHNMPCIICGGYACSEAIFKQALRHNSSDPEAGLLQVGGLRDGEKKTLAQLVKERQVYIYQP